MPVEEHEFAIADYLRKYLTMGHCPLLQAATSTAVDVRQQLKNCYATISRRQAYLSEEVLAQFHARYRLIDRFVDPDFSETSLTDAIVQLIDAVDLAWDYEDACSEEFEPVGEPSFLSVLRKPKSDVPMNGSRLAKLLETVRSDLDINWTHPGLLMTGEILAVLCGDSRTNLLRDQGQPGFQSWVLFAWNDADDPMGMLIPLRIERIEVQSGRSGSGLLLPHPSLSGYLEMNSSFSLGLQNAWSKAREYAEQEFGAGAHFGFDWRWSLDLSFVRQYPIPGELTQFALDGRSTEVAVACGLIAAHPKNPDSENGLNPLDPQIAATAMFKRPEKPLNHQLTAVEAIDVKTLLGGPGSKSRLTIRNAAKRQRLVDILVAKAQPKRDLPEESFDYTSVNDLKEAYTEMTRLRREASALNVYLAENASENLRERCNPYVMPAIGRPRLASHTGKKIGKTLQVMSRSELRTLFFFLWRNAAPPDDMSVAPRIFLRADSGTGKSILILQAENRIARSGRGMIPIRVGRTIETTYTEDGQLRGGELSFASIDWTKKTKQVIKQLLGCHSVANAINASRKRKAKRTGTQVSGSTTANRQLRRKFKQLLKRGQLVFLFDALDTVEGKLQGFCDFLNRPGVAQCPVLMTGRPEALVKHHKVFRQNNWHILELMPFDVDRQRRFLGSDLAGQLIANPYDKNLGDIVVEHLGKARPQKQMLQHLLPIPLLIDLIKKIFSKKSSLSTSQFKKVKSKFDLYDIAVKELINKGLTGLDDRRRKKMSPSKVIQMLGEIAYFMVKHTGFSNALTGEALEMVVKSIKKNYAIKGSVTDVLTQIDVMAAHQLTESTVEGLEFRHQSFLEFFAGLHLVSTRKQKVKNEIVEMDCVSNDERQALLAKIHAEQKQGDWQEILRFALSAASDPLREDLVHQLISLGNPWIVDEAIDMDQLKLPTETESLCRWLVHQFARDVFDFREPPDDECRALANQGWAKLEADQKTRLTAQHSRDARLLNPLREILPKPWTLYAEASHDSKQREAINRHIRNLSGQTGRWDFLSSFVSVEGGEFNIDQYHPSLKLGQIQVNSLEMADFPVTNELLQLFWPGYAQMIDLESHWPDDPAIHVNCHVAEEFCCWLSECTDDRFVYRLPTEWEWEWSCRWRNRCTEKFWWGQVEDRKLSRWSPIVGSVLELATMQISNAPTRLELKQDQLFVRSPRIIEKYLSLIRGKNQDDIVVERAVETMLFAQHSMRNRRISTRSRSASLRELAEQNLRHPSATVGRHGLLDMLGNTWEWCSNRNHQQDWLWALRGGSWNDSVAGCSCTMDHSRIGSSFIEIRQAGFRVCRVLAA